MNPTLHVGMGWRINTNASSKAGAGGDLSGSSRRIGSGKALAGYAGLSTTDDPMQPQSPIRPTAASGHQKRGNYAGLVVETWYQGPTQPSAQRESGSATSGRTL